MVSVDAVDTIDTAHLVTQLLLQVLPTNASASDRCWYAEGQSRAVSSEADDDIEQLASVQLEAREQAGCHLWDMTSSVEAASIAVQHAALNILPKVVMEALGQNQSRLAELLAGALANILCHHTLAEQAAQQTQLQQAAVDATFSTTDAACLAELFRLLTTALKGPGSSVWLVPMVQTPKSFFQHVVWIADNTLNATLLERAMDLLLALAYTSDQALQQVLAAGAMPVIISVVTAYADTVKRGSALQPDAATEPGEPSSGPSSSKPETFRFVPAPNAVLAALSLCQVLAQESENPLFSKHSSALCAVVTQLLHLHELLHCRASMQGMLVVILACLDSILWLDCLLSDAAVLQAVFEVLVNDSGFEEEVEAEEALQGQEAAWAVLAVVTKHVDTADTSMQCFTAHIDALTSSHLAEISPECARYVQRTLQQALEKTATSPSPDDPQRHEAQEALRCALQAKMTSKDQDAS
ncbi:hypothetical protein ABBQ38_006979 [Trebouxia sp. C0009 RCD-2024]